MPRVFGLTWAETARKSEALTRRPTALRMTVSAETSRIRRDRDASIGPRTARLATCDSALARVGPARRPGWERMLWPVLSVAVVVAKSLREAHIRHRFLPRQPLSRGPNRYDRPTPVAHDSRSRASKPASHHRRSSPFHVVRVRALRRAGRTARTRIRAMYRRNVEVASPRL